MVNNYDRIFSEITREAERLASDDIDSDILIALAMEIVDLEDQHRIKAIRINKLIEDKIVASTHQIRIKE